MVYNLLSKFSVVFFNLAVMVRKRHFSRDCWRNRNCFLRVLFNKIMSTFKSAFRALLSARTSCHLVSVFLVKVSFDFYFAREPKTHLLYHLLTYQTFSEKWLLWSPYFHAFPNQVHLSLLRFIDSMCARYAVTFEPKLFDNGSKS